MEYPPETVDSEQRPLGLLISADGCILHPRISRIRARGRGGIATIVLEQIFDNTHDVPLSVTYQVQLPSKAWVSGYELDVGGSSVVGEIDCAERAREWFEESILQRTTPRQMENFSGDLFSQAVGLIPPKTSVTTSLTIDHELLWLVEGAWEWRYPSMVCGKPLSDSPNSRCTVSLTIRDQLGDGTRPVSTSHPIVFARDDHDWIVTVDPDHGAYLDRDIVVRWAVARPEVVIELECSRKTTKRGRDGELYGLLTIVPPSPASPIVGIPRDVVLLLDTSGSLSGEPLAQTKRVTSALIDTLSDRDTLEMIAFSDRPQRWRSDPVRVDDEARNAAHSWLAGLEARGAAEMHSSLLEALRPVRAGPQRQVFLISDGLIGFERELVASIFRWLPQESRLHTIGVGSCVNHALLMPAARAGRGVAMRIESSADLDGQAQQLVTRTTHPLVVDLKLTGSALLSHSPRRVQDLYAGAPVVVALTLHPAGGDVRVSGRGPDGSWSGHVIVPPISAALESDGVVTFYGREVIADLEARRAAGDRPWTLDEAIENVGLDFQIASRLTKWFAASQRGALEPGKNPARRAFIPQALSQHMSMVELGVRLPHPPRPRPPRSITPQVAPPRISTPPPAPPPAPPPPETAKPPPLPRRIMKSPPPPVSVAASPGSNALFQLNIKKKSGEQAHYPFEKPEVTIGRSAGNDLILKEPGVSKRHARIVVKDDRFIVVDLKSTNGTYVNGHRINAPRVIKPGDTLFITDFMLLVEPSQKRNGGADRILSGQVLTARADLLVIEAQVIGQDLIWSPSRFVQILGASGSPLSAALNGEQSTRPGPVRRGQLVRIALMPNGGSAFGEARAILVSNGATSLRVEL